MGIYRGGTDILKFVTAGTDAITIDASQAVTLANDLSMDGDLNLVGSASQNLTLERSGASKIEIGASTAGVGNYINTATNDLFIKRTASFLKVLGVDNSTGDISFYEDTGSTVKLLWDSSAEKLLADRANGGYVFETAGSIRAGVQSDDQNNLTLRAGTDDIKMRIQADGSVGIGVVPESWSTTWDSLSVGVSGSFSAIKTSNLPRVFVSSNCYNDGNSQSGDWKYTNTDFASQYAQISGSHEFRVVSSGTEDAGITWNQAVIIDNSGNLLVGMTSPSNLTTGFSARANSLNSFCRDTATADAAVLALNKKTGDGDILTIQKDGSTVGSIGTGSSLLTIGKGTGNLVFDDALVAPAGTSSAGNSNGVVDLGSSSRRFKDLWLNGGAYIGGTTSANYLDDYEEGTWTPVYKGTTTDPVVAYQSGETFGKYTKIGDTVYIQCGIAIASLTSVGSGDMHLGGLPFTVNSSYSSAITVGANNDWGSNNHPSHARAAKNTTTIQLFKFTADPQDEFVYVDASGMLSGGNDNGVTLAGFYKV